MRKVVKKSPVVHWAWVILLIGFIDLFINFSVRLGYGVVLPEMIRTLDFGRAAGGTVYNSYLFTYIAITPFTGYLTDRLGARRIISVCLLILGAGVVMMGTIGTLRAASFFFGLVGLGASGLWTPVITLVQRWFAFHRRGLALGILSTGYGLGFATMGAVFPLIVQSLDWHNAWFFLGAMALCMALINAVFLRSDPQETGLAPWGENMSATDGIESSTATENNISLRRILRDRRFWLIGLSYFAIAYSLYGITTFMVDYAKYQLGLPLQKASLLATLHGIGQICGVLTILPLSDFLGRKKAIIISNTFIAAALAGILLAGDYFPKGSMGTVIGAWTPFYGIGAILTHWITGALRDSTGSYNHTFIISALMALAGMFLMSRVKKGKGGAF